MAAPYCGTHRCMFNIEKNGVVLATKLGDGSVPSWLNRGDLWQCPRGGERIIVGLGQTMYPETPGYEIDIKKVDYTIEE